MVLPYTYTTAKSYNEFTLFTNKVNYKESDKKSTEFIFPV